MTTQTVPDWRYVPGRGPDHPQPLVRIWCEGCETYSRPVRPPTPVQIAEARERFNAPNAPINPDPPKGWEDGCPRCDR